MQIMFSNYFCTVHCISKAWKEARVCKEQKYVSDDMICYVLDDIGDVGIKGYNWLYLFLQIPERIMDVGNQKLKPSLTCI